jgi:hypothetical protein
MAEIVSCPHCSCKLSVPQEVLGQNVQCSSCGAAFTATLARQGAFSPSPPAVPFASPPPVDPQLSYSAPPPEKTSGGGDRRYYTDYYDEVDGRGPGHEDEIDYAPRRRYRRRDLLPHRGDTILLLGLASLGTIMFCWPFNLALAIAAWVMGQHDLAEMREGRMDPDGQGNTQAGRVCGIVSVAVSVLLVLGGIAFFWLLSRV